MEEKVTKGERYVGEKEEARKRRNRIVMAISNEERAKKEKEVKELNERRKRRKQFRERRGRRKENKATKNF